MAGRILIKNLFSNNYVRGIGLIVVAFLAIFIADSLEASQHLIVLSAFLAVLGYLGVLRWVAMGKK